MTVSELIRELREVVLLDPEAANLPFYAEEHDSWKGYHLSPGIAKSGNRNKLRITLRQEKWTW